MKASEEDRLRDGEVIDQVIPEFLDYPIICADYNPPSLDEV